MEINQVDIRELRARPFQRKFFLRPDLSLVVAWADKDGAIHLTVDQNQSTLSLEATAGGRVGLEDPT